MSARLFDVPVGEPIYDAGAIVEAAVEWFRATGFPIRHVPIHVAMQELNALSEMGQRQLRATTVGYTIPDRYNPHRYGVPVQRRLEPRVTATEAFGDDAMFRKALLKALTIGSGIPAGWFAELGLVEGVQVAANFRPGWAAACYRQYCPPGAFVIDPCCGFGGRLLGALASRTVGTYMGIDPSPLSVEGNRRMAAELARDMAVDLKLTAVEDVDVDEFRKQADFILTSPPYWRKEHYDGADQSWRRYATFDEWGRGFLLPMLRRVEAWLKLDACAVIVAADVRVAYQRHSLLGLLTDLANEVGLISEARDRMSLARRPGGGDAPERLEHALVFRKAAS